MGHFLFFLFVVTACLLWSAAWTAAAARTHRAWPRRLLEAVAVLPPVVAIAPCVWFTAYLAFTRHMPTNWFGPVLTAFLAAAIGVVWIAWAGLGWRWHALLSFADTPVPPAARWPVVGLAALCVLATAVAGGTLLTVDNAVAARAPYLRLEAGQLMQANMPAVVADAQNAASLYRRAFAALDADAAIKAQDSPLSAATTIDPASPAVTDLLARHAATLDLLRRAAARDSCRFERDWTRPSLDLLLPELSSLRVAARLLVLHARRAAADGRATEALGDVVRIGRIGRHAAGEPILISSLVGLAIDAMAVDTLAEVLPRLEQSDAAALDAPELADLVAMPPATAGHFYGEEAFGLSTFADLADSRLGVANLPELVAVNQSQRPFVFRILPLTLLYRVFFLEADLAGYRSLLRKYQQLAAGSEPYPDVKKQTDTVEADLRDRSPGLMSSLIVPAMGAVFRTQAQAIARHGAAAALVAATRQRLETGAVPTTAEAIVATLLPPAPRDPFTADRPLLVKRTDHSLIVYSVGPDGEDDGGPVAPGAPKPDGNDDVGLQMAAQTARP